VAAVAATTGLVLGGTAIVGAYFTSEAQVDGQQVATTTVEVDADMLEGHAPIDVQGMLPGDSAVTFVEVTNTGAADLYYSLRVVADDDADEDLAEALMVRLTVAGGPSHEATLADWADGHLQAATALADGDTLPVFVAVDLPLAADDDVQGLAAGFGVVVEAIQTAHVDQPADVWITD
jgi:hypothetical protein